MDLKNKGLFNFSSNKKIELSEFIPKFLQTIVSSRVLHDIPLDQFSATEIEKIHKELNILRYILFYFFIYDSVRGGHIDGLDSQNAIIVDSIFNHSLELLPSTGNFIDIFADVKNALQDYKKIISSKSDKDYSENGYFYIVANCLNRCGYEMPLERKNGDTPVTKEEGVFDIINQTYLATQSAFTKTVKNYPVYFKKLSN